MNKYILGIVILFAASFCCSLSAAQTVRHSYRFYNTLSTTDGDCAPDLIPTKGLNVQCNPFTAATSGQFIMDTLTSGVSRVVYHNNLNWGLKYLNTTGVIGTTYTVQLYFKVTNFNQFYTRVIDFSNGLSDNGLYFTNYNTPPPATRQCLNFYPNGNFGICPFFNDTTYYLLTITRDNSTRKIDIYVNDQLFTSYNDLAGFYTSTINKPVHIFRDDPVGFSCEDGEANFAYISFANFYSTQADVSQVYNAIDTVASTADFTFAPDAACSGSNVAVIYNGNIPSNASGYTFTWNWDGGTIVSGSGRGPYTINWATAGIKNVTLNITGGSCAATISNSKQVTISNTVNLQKDTSICNGASYLGHSSSGTYIQQLPSTTGCDTSLTIHLTVLPPALSAVDTTVCTGASVEGFSTSGTHIRNLVAASGCDSTRTIRLTVLPAALSSVDTTICAGLSFEGFNTPGTHVRNLVAASGCDSTRTIRLTVLPAALSSVDTTICAGLSFEGFNTSGLHVRNLVAASGCDSTRTIRLTVLPAALSSVDTTICAGLSFEGFTTSGTHVRNLATAFGCDSTRTIRLTVLPTAVSFVDTTICAGLPFEGFTVSGTHIRNLITALGCDSIRTIRLTVLPAAVSAVDTSICAGASFEGFTTSGTYIKNLRAASGCDSTRTIRLSVSPVALPDLGTKNVLCSGDSIFLSPGIFDSYLWQDGSTQKTFTVKTGGLYSVTVKNSCIDTSATLLVQESSCNILFPTAFTPGNGGVNQSFRVSQGNIFSEYYLTVFNRYGQKVFETVAPATGWDGKYKGTDAALGAYVWFCHYKKSQAMPLRVLKGTVVLLR
ncbi:MAG: gliding motility-associated C-terminal domain-containing protein [Chitinophagaceae bacterium]|nr:gliding motility-associated C-terminal domain-containing protein [Chitinophagaceae bacterium]